MVFVVLKTGKVIQYNDGGSIAEEGSSYAIRTRDNSGLVARVPVANVERIEFGRPCDILKARQPRPRKFYER